MLRMNPGAWLLPVAPLLVGAFACNSILGIEEPIERVSAAGPGGASSAGGAGGAGGGGGGFGGSVDPGEPPCDPAEQPIEAAVFVSPTGNDMNGGSKLLPVQTIARALEVAKAALAERIYLHEGSYLESVVFDPAHQGIFVEGGWTASGEQWVKNCAPGILGRTVIAAPGNVGVQVTGVQRASGLRFLTVATLDRLPAVAEQSGDSAYGVRVKGSGAAFRLEWIRVVAGKASVGGDAAQAPAQSGTQACDGNTNCCDQATVSGCGTQSGPVQPALAPQGDPALVGVFGLDGFTAGNGATGVLGTVGHHGKIGGTGQSATCTTDQCGNCQSGNCVGFSPGMAFTGYGGTGRCGCGGEGGLGGFGGRGGGASVALFVSDGATVVMENCRFETLGGGDGASGGAGGLGGPPSGGQTGIEQYCTLGCYTGCSNVCYQGTNLAGGSPGTVGGLGGDGGPGGGGAGGPSIAVVTVGASVVEMGANLFEPGPGGMGVDGAPNGESSNALQLP